MVQEIKTMKIDYESLRKFARENGDIEIYAPKGKAVILKDGTTDVYSIVENASTFVFGGKPYTRPEFEKLLSESAPSSK